MLINKEITNYGYKSKIRYDVKTPTLYVLQPNTKLKLEGQADITLVTGNITISRLDNNKTIYDKLTDKDTYRIPPETTVTINSTNKSVIIEDNQTTSNVEEYLKLTVIEDEPSSDDLNYIEEEND